MHSNVHAVHIPPGTPKAPLTGLISCYVFSFFPIKQQKKWPWRKPQARLADRLLKGAGGSHAWPDTSLTSRGHRHPQASGQEVRRLGPAHGAQLLRGAAGTGVLDGRAHTWLPTVFTPDAPGEILVTLSGHEGTKRGGGVWSRPARHPNQLTGGTLSIL